MGGSLEPRTLTPGPGPSPPSPSKSTAAHPTSGDQSHGLFFCFTHTRLCVFAFSFKKGSGFRKTNATCIIWQLFLAFILTAAPAYRYWNLHKTILLPVPLHPGKKPPRRGRGGSGRALLSRLCPPPQREIRGGGRGSTLGAHTQGRQRKVGPGGASGGRKNTPWRPGTLPISIQQASRSERINGV